MKELNDLDSNRKLEDIRRCSNKELIVTRDMLEGFKSLKEYAKLGKQRSFQYVSGKLWNGLMMGSTTKKPGNSSFGTLMSSGRVLRRPGAG